MLAKLHTREPPIIIQCERLAKLMANVDPVSAVTRWAQVTHRKKYSVPQVLIHIVAFRHESFTLSFRYVSLVNIG